MWALREAFLIDVAPCGAWTALVPPHSAVTDALDMLQECSGRGQQNSCQNSLGLQEALGQCELSLSWQILNSLMRMLIQFEQ